MKKKKKKSALIKRTDAQSDIFPCGWLGAHQQTVKTICKYRSGFQRMLNFIFYSFGRRVGTYLCIGILTAATHWAEILLICTAALQIIGLALQFLQISSKQKKNSRSTVLPSDFIWNLSPLLPNLKSVPWQLHTHITIILFLNLWKQVH